MPGVTLKATPPGPHEDHTGKSVSEIPEQTKKATSPGPKKGSALQRLVQEARRIQGAQSDTSSTISHIDHTGTPDSETPEQTKKATMPGPHIDPTPTSDSDTKNRTTELPANSQEQLLEQQLTELRAMGEPARRNKRLYEMSFPQLKNLAKKIRIKGGIWIKKGKKAKGKNKLIEGILAELA